MNPKHFPLFAFTSPAKRVFGYDKMSMFTRFSLLALQTKSINLGQGFPNFPPPTFLRKFLSENCQSGSLQYQSAGGNPKLTDQISKMFEPILQKKINPQTDIAISAGAASCLSFTFQGIIDPGDEVIVFDPSFDNYRPQVEFAGGKVRGVPLIPKSKNSQSLMKQRGPNYVFSKDQDVWEIDWSKLASSFNEKTKAIVINSPNNPIGKIYSQEELQEIAKYLKKYPKVLIVEDIAYQHIAFNPYTPFNFPMFFKMPELQNRTISISSGGKLFSSTGLRIGWAIGNFYSKTIKGNEKLIKGIKSIHQYSVFCLSEPLQLAYASCIELASKNDYFQQTAKQYESQCNLLLRSLTESKLELDLWVPQGGCEIQIVFQDTSCQVISPGLLSLKNFTLILMMVANYQKTLLFAFVRACKKFGVVPIPMASFYGKEDRHLGENQVRWAFCKTTEDIQEAARRLK